MTRGACVAALLMMAAQAQGQSGLRVLGGGLELTHEYGVLFGIPYSGCTAIDRYETTNKDKADDCYGNDNLDDSIAPASVPLSVVAMRLRHCSIVPAQANTGILR